MKKKKKSDDLNWIDEEDLDEELREELAGSVGLFYGEEMFNLWLA